MVPLLILSLTAGFVPHAVQLPRSQLPVALRPHLSLPVVMMSDEEPAPEPVAEEPAAVEEAAEEEDLSKGIDQGGKRKYMPREGARRLKTGAIAEPFPAPVYTAMYGALALAIGVPLVLAGTSEDGVSHKAWKSYDEVPVIGGMLSSMSGSKAPGMEQAKELKAASEATSAAKYDAVMKGEAAPGSVIFPGK